MSVAAAAPRHRPSLIRLGPILFSLLSTLVRAYPTSSSSNTLTLAIAATKHGREDDRLTKGEYVEKLVISAGLVLLGGVFAGLTLGLMGLDALHLRVLMTSSDNANERVYARKVLKLLNRGRHWVLVVLLLGNVIVNESLPIFLDSVLGGGAEAVVASTLLIVVFGEIIPQSLGVRYGLAIGAYSSPFVLTMMYLFAPVAWPIAKLLDYILGANEEHTYKKAELKSFLAFHKHGEEPLRDDEITILNGVLSLNATPAGEIMTPIADVMTVATDTVLDHDMIDKILLTGFSRVPVHKPGQPKAFVGMLLIKKLLLYNPEDSLPVSHFQLSTLPEAKPTISLFQALDYFQTGRAHLLLLSDTPGLEGGALGVISLEDIIEEIIGEEIVDETDRLQDNRSKKSARRTGTAEVMKGIIERERRRIVSKTMSECGSPRVLDTPALRDIDERLLFEQLDGGNGGPPAPANGGAGGAGSESGSLLRQSLLAGVSGTTNLQYGATSLSSSPVNADIVERSETRR